MELFRELFGAWLVCTYPCFDRMVISGYRMGLQRCGQVVYWLREVRGLEQIDKAALSRRTEEYVAWVQAFARKQPLPLEWAEKGGDKEEYVRPYLRRMERAHRYGGYFIFQAMEQGWTFRPGRVPVPQPDGTDYPIRHGHRSRYRFYSFSLRDPVLGPISVRLGTCIPFEASYWVNGHSAIERELQNHGVAFRTDDNAFLAVRSLAALQAAADRLSGERIRKRLEYGTFVLGPKFRQADRKAANLERSSFVHQVEYCQNCLFHWHHPIDHLVARSGELGLWRLTGDKVIHRFGRKSRHRLTGKRQTLLERGEHGAHVFRAYWKPALLKQYEKYTTFLRHEATSNNLTDFGLKKGLAYLGEAREQFLGVLDRFASLQAETLNVHADFALLRRIALPVQHGAVRVPGIRVQDARSLRLLEALLHAGTAAGGWSSRQLHASVLDRFRLPPGAYGLHSLRYDLRKLKGHDLVEREPGKYAYRLTDTGQRVAVLFLLFHYRLCGPLAGSQFHHRPSAEHRPAHSKLEAAYYRADNAIDNVIAVLKAA